jgi:cytidyltransferase-like protein
MNFLKIVKNLLIEENKEVIAVIPGSFKPPHAGHIEMIDAYSKKANEVKVIISAPSKKKRLTKLGTEITADDALKIFNIIKKAYNWDNVEILISKFPSPVVATYNYIENELKNVDVIIGTSKKSGDEKRFSSLAKGLKKDNPTVNVLDIEKNAVNVKSNFSATDLRANIDDVDFIKSHLPKKLKDNDIEKIFKILNK